MLFGVRERKYFRILLGVGENKGGSTSRMKIILWLSKVAKI
jgi:hypothetical protein